MSASLDVGAEDVAEEKAPARAARGVALRGFGVARFAVRLERERELVAGSGLIREARWVDEGRYHFSMVAGVTRKPASSCP